MLTLAVFGTSQKRHENRIPIHPDHFSNIAPELRKRMFFEENYAHHFGLSKADLEKLFGGVLSRRALLEKTEIVLMAKPTLQDFQAMANGTIHWGWPHCVQQQDITQTAIDNKLTLIAWEAMHEWSEEGAWQSHTFHKNNEIAGYAGVHHAFNLLGIDGNFGPARKAAIFGFGSVSRGAIQGLQSRGLKEVTVYLPEGIPVAKDGYPEISKIHLKEGPEGRLVCQHPSGGVPLIDELSTTDILVNGILQDTDHPLMFVNEDEVPRLKPGCLIIDISCDEGMGFPFARPTTFDEPMFSFGQGHYYAVDHTPSYLWNAASWEISRSLLPYLPLVMAGPRAWKSDQTIRKAIEIQDGVIQNPKILSFQNRGTHYPHPISTDTHG